MRNITIKTEGAIITKGIPERFDALIYFAQNAQYQRLAEGKEISQETEEIIRKLEELNKKYRLKARGR